VVDGQITVAGKVYVPSSSRSLPTILSWAHDLGHEDVENTLHFMCQAPTSSFKIMFVHVSLVSKIKLNTCTLLVSCSLWKFPRPFGPISQWISWKDFHASVILTLVNRFSKEAHCIPLGHPYMATSAAREFFNGVVKLHGIPSLIVRDRDPSLLAIFGKSTSLWQVSSSVCHRHFILSLTGKRKQRTRSLLCIYNV
jgi:hypothetical protein